MARERIEGERRPAHGLAHDAGDDGRRCGHERGVRREVGGDFDAVGARADAHARRAPVRREQHDRKRQYVREQERQPLHAAVAARAPGCVLERDVVVSAESDQARAAAVPPLPCIQLAACEADAFPKRAAGARAAAARDLDDRRRDLEHAGVEVHRAAGRQVVRRAPPVHERATDERAGIAEHVLGPDGSAIHDQRELRFHADRRQLQASGPLRRALSGLLRVPPHVLLSRRGRVPVIEAFRAPPRAAPWSRTRGPGADGRPRFRDPAPRAGSTRRAPCRARLSRSARYAPACRATRRRCGTRSPRRPSSGATRTATDGVRGCGIRRWPRCGRTCRRRRGTARGVRRAA